MMISCLGRRCCFQAHRRPSPVPWPDKGMKSGMKLADRPNTKPVKCIGLVNMSNGMVLPKGKVAASIKYRYVHKNNLYDGRS